MTISNILEHWATIYKPLSHKPDSQKLNEQSFFRIRYIDLENIFVRNANLVHSPCMLYSVVSTGKLEKAKQAKVTCQVWFLAKMKDTPQTLGRYDGEQIERATTALSEMCEDLIAWLVEVRRTGVCPVTHRSFANDPQTLGLIQSVDLNSFAYGVIPDIYAGQWMIAGLDWECTKKLYNFDCGSKEKYVAAEPENP